MKQARQAHWQRVYADRRPDDVSWYQSIPEKSLQLIRATGVAGSAPILDAGGGASTLVDHLLAAGYTDVSVLDISSKALDRSRTRLGESAGSVTWIESDVTALVPDRRYALWHDRAVFHFLTDPADREKYIETVCRALRADGYLVLSTFGLQGPERCSGLPVTRYGISELQDLLGAEFELGGYELDMHETPNGSTQQFLYSSWQRRHQKRNDRMGEES